MLQKFDLKNLTFRILMFFFISFELFRYIGTSEHGTIYLYFFETNPSKARRKRFGSDKYSSSRFSVSFLSISTIFLGKLARCSSQFFPKTLLKILEIEFTVINLVHVK